MIYFIKEFDPNEPIFKFDRGFAFSLDKAKEMVEILKEENIKKQKKLDGDDYQETTWETNEIDGIITYYEIYNAIDNHQCWKAKIFQIKPFIEGKIYDDDHKEIN